MLLELAMVALLAADERDHFQLAGDARWQANVLRLTPPERQQAGAAWRREKQFLAGGFESSFRFQISQTGGLDNGADGLAFVMQNTSPEAVAGRGGAGGFMVEGPGAGGPERQAIGYSLAVFFDTHRNPETRDPSNNYVGLFTFGPASKAKWPPPRLGASRRLPVFLKGGTVIAARIRYEPPLLSVWLGGELVLRTSVDPRQVLDAEGKAWVGFTASTGNGWAAHDILDWKVESIESTLTSVDSQISFAPSVVTANCLPGRNLCTPKEASVEGKSPDRFEILLPGHLEWGASIPNPQSRPVEIRNASGFVCWREGECSGPAGVIQLKNQDGRTYFSVSSQGLPFTRHEGYFAFTAILGTPPR